MTEVYKFVKGKAPAIMKNLFIFRENIRNIKNFKLYLMRTKMQLDTGWKLCAMELLICGQGFQKNINIRILYEISKKK